jgi:23S rRNA (uracil1939-C5)-methyltransferase
MRELTLTLTSMAHGGSAMGRDGEGRAIFVPFAIPGEEVRVQIASDKRTYARADLVEILQASPDRVEARCPHFALCGGCHFQHMRYDSQLRAKQDVVRDQLKRIGGLEQVDIRPILPNPSPWAYRIDVTLFPTPEGGLGFWSPGSRRVIPFDTCHIIHPALLQLWQDFELSLPELRKLTLRIGDDEALLAALEVNDVEPPEIQVDFPVSVSIVLPDGTSASLVGDNFLVQSVKGRDFRVSPGCYFPPCPAATSLLVDAVLSYAALSETKCVLELYSGVGMLTTFLADRAGGLIGIEPNPDAVADATYNLYHSERVTLYQGRVEEIVPLLPDTVDVVVASPSSGGLTPAAIHAVVAAAPERLVYVSTDVATLARDGKQLSRSGYDLVEIQPIDMCPQTFQIDTVSSWQRAPAGRRVPGSTATTQ